MKRIVRMFALTAALIALSGYVVPPAALGQSEGSGSKGSSSDNKSKTKKKSRKPAKPKPHSFAVGPAEVMHYAVEETSQRNEITFTSKAPKETINGKSAQVVGHLDVNPRKLATAKGRFSVAWKSLDTGHSMRNTHMMSSPWVDATTYPEIVFTVSGIERSKRKGGGKSVTCKLLGTMAMNGKEKDIKVPATLVYVEPGKSKEGEAVKEGIGIRATFKVSLKDYDIKGRGVGDKVARRPTVKVALFLAREEAPKNDSTDAGEDSGNEDDMDEEESD